MSRGAVIGIYSTAAALVAAFGIIGDVIPIKYTMAEFNYSYYN